MLEIGSVVYLKDGSRKVMILNRGPVIEGKGYCEYSGCLYPIGLVPDEVFYFNEENIEKVLHRGFHDVEEDRFLELYANWQKDNEGKITKILVEGPEPDPQA